MLCESMSSVSPGTLKNNQNNNSKDIKGRQNLRLKVWAEKYERSIEKTMSNSFC